MPGDAVIQLLGQFYALDSFLVKLKYGPSYYSRA